VTIERQARYSIPVRPLFVVSAAAALSIAVAVGFARWDRGGGETTTTTTNQGFASSYAPNAPTAEEALKAEMAIHEAWTTATFGPLIPATVPGDVVAAALAEHENALSAVLGEQSASGDADTEAEVARAIAEHDASFPVEGIDR